MVPALPPPVGPNVNKARFFAEAAASFELLALYHQLTPEEQIEFRQYTAGLAAEVAARSLKDKK